MPQWHNWSGRLKATPARMAFIRHEADAQALALKAAAENTSIRTAGACHSHSALVEHSGIIADCRGLTGVESVDTAEGSAWLRGGSRIYSLGRALHEHGLALINQGDIDEQSIAGATATGTHGTGVTLGNLSNAVLAMELATADGKLTPLSAEQNPELFQAARLHLGAFGIVTRLKLKLMPATVFKEQSWAAPLDSVLEKTPVLIDTNRHFEFFWYPAQDRAQAKTINPTTDSPVYPLGKEGERIAWSYEVLPNYRPAPHTEMEYSVPLDGALDCMQEIQQLLRQKHTDVVWPVEFRTLAADNVWLSTAFERATATISVHQDVGVDETAYYRDCEAIFLRYGGRPHWGKVHYLDALELEAAHPHYREWWARRDAIDPDGVFLNDYLLSLRPQ